MPLNDEGHVRSLVQQLDEAVPREGTVVVSEDDEEGDFYTLVTADQLGYLRLGIEFLKAAFLSPAHKQRPYQVTLELRYLKGLEKHCYRFDRREDISAPIPDEEEAGEGLSGVPALLLLFFILAALVIGALSIITWLFRLVF